MSETNFKSMSVEALADLLGEIDGKVKPLTKSAEALKGELKRRGVTSVRGSKFIVSITETNSIRIDTTSMKQDAENDKKLAKIIAKYEKSSASARVLIQPAPTLITSIEDDAE